VRPALIAAVIAAFEGVGDTYGSPHFTGELRATRLRLKANVVPRLMGRLLLAVARRPWRPAGQPDMRQSADATRTMTVGGAVRPSAVIWRAATCSAATLGMARRSGWFGMVCPAFRGVALLDFMPRSWMVGSRTPWG